MKLNLKVLFILLVLIIQVKAQTIQVLDAFMDIKCLNCDKIAKDRTKFMFTLKCRFAEKSVVPRYALMPFNDTTVHSPYLHMLDSEMVNCEKYYRYGPLLWESVKLGGSIYFGIFFGDSVKLINDSNVFNLNFEIFLPHVSNINSNFKIAEMPTKINAHSDFVELALIKENLPEFYSEFQVIIHPDDSFGFQIADKRTPILSINPSSLSYGYHTIKLIATGQIEDVGGAIHITESFHTIFLDSTIIPIEWFQFEGKKNVQKNLKLISYFKGEDSILLAFKYKLNGNDYGNLNVNFNINGRELRKLNFINDSIVFYTVYGKVTIKNFDLTYNQHQFLSISISQKEDCGIVYSDVWELVFDSLSSGYDELNYQPQLTIYPNPFLNTIEVSCEQNFDFELLNSLGISAYNGKGLAGTNEFELNKLPIGIYIAKITAGNKSYFRKLVKHN